MDRRISLRFFLGKLGRRDADSSLVLVGRVTLPFFIRQDLIINNFDDLHFSGFFPHDFRVDHSHLFAVPLKKVLQKGLSSKRSQLVFESSMLSFQFFVINQPDFFLQFLVKFNVILITDHYFHQSSDFPHEFLHFPLHVLHLQKMIIFACRPRSNNFLTAISDSDNGGLISGNEDACSFESRWCKIECIVLNVCVFYISFRLKGSFDDLFRSIVVFEGNELRWIVIFDRLLLGHVLKRIIRFYSLD